MSLSLDEVHFSRGFEVRHISASGIGFSPVVVDMKSVICWSYLWRRSEGMLYGRQECCVKYHGMYMVPGTSCTGRLSISTFSWHVIVALNRPMQDATLRYMPYNLPSRAGTFVRSLESFIRTVTIYRSLLLHQKETPR